MTRLLTFLALLVLAAASAARAQPNSARADSLVAAGRAATADGDHGEAWRLFRAAYDPVADDARVLALLAGATAARGDMAPFRALLDSLVRTDGAGSHAVEYWAAIALDSGTPADSVVATVAERAAARPEDVRALRGVARVLSAHGYDLAAIALFDRAVARGVDAARLAVARGELLEAAGDAAGALDAWLGAAAEPEAVARLRALLDSRPPGYARDPLLEQLRRARDRGAQPAAGVAAMLLTELDAPATAPPPRAPSDDPIAAARDTTELAAALLSGRPLDARIAALRAGDLWLARGVRDSAVAAYARAVDAAPPVGAPAFEALARIRLVRALGGLPVATEVGMLAIQAEGNAGGSADALEALVAASALPDSAAARPLLAALAGEWRGRAGDPAGASARLEAAARVAGAEAPALLLAAGRWARTAREEDRARTLWRAVVERHGDTPYALEARRLLAGNGG